MDVDKIKVYRVINDQGIHEYNIHEYLTPVDLDVCYELYTSNTEGWAEPYRNEKLLSITNNGNGYKMSRSLGKNIDYNNMAELLILLWFIQKTDYMYRGSIVEVKEEHITFI